MNYRVTELTIFTSSVTSFHPWSICFLVTPLERAWSPRSPFLDKTSVIKTDLYWSKKFAFRFREGGTCDRSIVTIIEILQRLYDKIFIRVPYTYEYMLTNSHLWWQNFFCNVMVMNFYDLIYMQVVRNKIPQATPWGVTLVELGSSTY